MLLLNGLSYAQPLKGFVQHLLCSNTSLWNKKCPRMHPNRYRLVESAQPFSTTKKKIDISYEAVISFYFLKTNHIANLNCIDGEELRWQSFVLPFLDQCKQCFGLRIQNAHILQVIDTIYIRSQLQPYKMYISQFVYFIVSEIQQIGPHLRFAFLETLSRLNRPSFAD